LDFLFVETAGEKNQCFLSLGTTYAGWFRLYKRLYSVVLWVKFSCLNEYTS